MFMKKFSLCFTILLCVVILTACNGNEPKIEIELKVTPVSEEEYNKIGTTKVDEPKQEDFKLLEFNFIMEHTDSVKERRIDIDKLDNLERVLNEIDGNLRYWYGNWSNQDNENENFATYHHESVFYAKGLSENDIKKAFSNETISVSWSNHKNETIKKEYNISDLIEFSSK